MHLDASSRNMLAAVATSHSHRPAANKGRHQDLYLRLRRSTYGTGLGRMLDNGHSLYLSSGLRKQMSMWSELSCRSVKLAAPSRYSASSKEA